MQRSSFGLPCSLLSSSRPPSSPQCSCSHNSPQFGLPCTSSLLSSSRPPVSPQCNSQLPLLGLSCMWFLPSLGSVVSILLSLSDCLVVRYRCPPLPESSQCPALAWTALYVVPTVAWLRRLNTLISVWLSCSSLPSPAVARVISTPSSCLDCFVCGSYHRLALLSHCFVSIWTVL